MTNKKPIQVGICVRYTTGTFTLAFVIFKPNGDVVLSQQYGDYQQLENDVYIICWVNSGQEVPFYIGQTRRLRDRMDDYREKQFAASTDFRVGEAICYLQKEKKFRIIVKYKQFANHKAEEYKIIRDLQTAGVRLLNDLMSYDYKHAQKQDERESVRKFCEVLIRSKLYLTRSPQA